MCRKHAEIEWARRGISIFYCYHSVKLCILAAWAFQSQQSGVLKVVPSATFTKRMCDWSGSLQKAGDVVATSQLMLRWKCDSPQMGCAQRATKKYMWREQATIELSCRVISIIACCHSVKLCALTYLSSFLITTQEIYFLVFRMPNAWKWPEMNMYLDLNLATFHDIDGFGCYQFLLNRFGLELIIFFWTLSQLSVQFWDYRLLQDRKLRVDCSHQHVGSHLLQAQCCVALSQPKKQSNRWSSG